MKYVCYFFSGCWMVLLILYVMGLYTPTEIEIGVTMFESSLLFLLGAEIEEGI